MIAPHPHILNRRRFLLRVPQGRKSGPTTILHDTFTDANGTSLDAHTIAPVNTPAVSWVEDSGNLQISSNRACVQTEANYTRASVNVGVADCTITGGVNCGINSNPGIVHDVGFVVRNSAYSPALNATADLLRISEAFATSRATASLAIANSTEYAASVTLNGAAISITVNGVTATYTGATVNQTTTNHGLRVNWFANYVDDFKVTTL